MVWFFVFIFVHVLSNQMTNFLKQLFFNWDHWMFFELVIVLRLIDEKTVENRKGIHLCGQWVLFHFFSEQSNRTLRY